MEQAKKLTSKYHPTMSNSIMKASAHILLVLGAFYRLLSKYPSRETIPLQYKKIFL
jgi:hypothetical protein